jgi:hypothetical protein
MVLKINRLGHKLDSIKFLFNKFSTNMFSEFFIFNLLCYIIKMQCYITDLGIEIGKNGTKFKEG